MMIAALPMLLTGSIDKQIFPSFQHKALYAKSWVQAREKQRREEFPFAASLETSLNMHRNACKLNAAERQTDLPLFPHKA